MNYNLTNFLIEVQCCLFVANEWHDRIISIPADQRWDFQGRFGTDMGYRRKQPSGYACEEHHKTSHASKSRISFLCKSGCSEQCVTTHVKAKPAIVRTIVFQVCRKLVESLLNLKVIFLLPVLRHNAKSLSKRLWCIVLIVYEVIRPERLEGFCHRISIIRPQPIQTNFDGTLPSFNNDVVLPSLHCRQDVGVLHGAQLFIGGATVQPEQLHFPTASKALA
mmetsp:Transcript_111165/g.192754  ORF Transcript_111165/g.192754 Transcript_111165/m.192754 type:complete len:221 (-) Transcript_111165:185-847(-)